MHVCYVYVCVRFVRMWLELLIAGGYTVSALVVLMVVVVVEKRRRCLLRHAQRPMPLAHLVQLLCEDPSGRLPVCVRVWVYVCVCVCAVCDDVA